MKSELFGNLLSEGFSSAAKRQGMTMEAVERAIAEKVGLSVDALRWHRKGNIPDTADLLGRIETITEYCLNHGRLRPDWARDLLKVVRHPNPNKFNTGATQAKSRVFVCYARDSEPDQTLAVQLAQRLNENYALFFDQPRSFHTQLALLQQELAEADWLILLLSAEAMTNEVVLAEMEIAHTLVGQGGLPKLLPVLINYHLPPDEPFRTYLNACQWAVWGQPADTERLLTELKVALAGGDLPWNAAMQPPAQQAANVVALAPPRPMVYLPQVDMPEGTMRPTSPFYIERETDAIALHTLQQEGETIVIKGARQMGKSSLAIRCAERGKQAGRRIALLDFQLMNLPDDDPTRFFRQFCVVLGRKLGIENRLASFWDDGLGSAYNCTEYISNYVLEEIAEPVMLLIDEPETLFNAPFCTDFFAMLRVWHNQRASSPAFRRLDLILITSTEPYFFIENLNQSPFNVGEVLKLQEFTAIQMAELNRRHNSPLSAAQLDQLGNLVGGHPYLMRRGLYLVATGRLAASTLLAQANEEQGPFGDHLRSLLLRLHQRPQLLQSLRQVLNEQQCSDPLARWRLLGAGLVREEKNRVQMRFPLYQQFFQERLS